MTRESSERREDVDLQSSRRTTPREVPGVRDPGSESRRVAGSSGQGLTPSDEELGLRDDERKSSES